MGVRTTKKIVPPGMHAPATARPGVAGEAVRFGSRSGVLCVFLHRWEVRARRTERQTAGRLQTEGAACVTCGIQGRTGRGSCQCVPISGMFMRARPASTVPF